MCSCTFIVSVGGGEPKIHPILLSLLFKPHTSKVPESRQMMEDGLCTLRMNPTWSWNIILLCVTFDLIIFG